MANQFIAFLRAINVGGHVVKMDALAIVFEQLGFGNVATFIASGNVIFTSTGKDTAKLEPRVEQGLEKALGYPVTTFIRTTREVVSLAEYKPFKTVGVEGSTLYVGFLSTTPAAEARKRIDALRTADDDFRIEGRELFWWRRGNLMESAVSGALLEKTLKMPMTMRNVNTVKRLAAKYPPPPSD